MNQVKTLEDATRFVDEYWDYLFYIKTLLKVYLRGRLYKNYWIVLGDDVAFKDET